MSTDKQSSGITKMTPSRQLGQGSHQLMHSHRLGQGSQLPASVVVAMGITVAKHRLGSLPATNPLQTEFRL